MAARIVYEGAAGDGGELFQGKKIWLSHRVPLRSTFKEQVESNGGVVVALEKNADVIIVDHKRRECPPGSISWTWIEQSVKRGRLEDVENHRAGPTHAQNREVGSAQPTKKTRTPFTAEDDRMLMDWVARAERKGLPILGNVIYQQFAEKYPHHTWQSWLDRWKRYVSVKKRPSLSEDEDEDEGEDLEPMPAPPKPRRPRKQPAVSQPRPLSPTPPSLPLPPSRTRPTPKPHVPLETPVASPGASERSHNSMRSLKANPFILKSSGGIVFTSEESELLFDAYDDIMDLSDDQVIDAWIAWSVENSNHTPQEWRNHFNEYVIPTRQARLESVKAAKQAKEMPPPQNIQPRETILNTSTAIPATSSISEIKDSQDSSGQTVLTPAQGDEPSDSYTSSEREFEKNLLILADQLEVEVNPNPVICGRMVPLFSLWQVVHSDGFEGFDEVTGRRLWCQVARKLGFDNSQEKLAGRDLRDCYSEILCDLESAERTFLEGQDITASQEAEMIADQFRQTAEESERLNGNEDGHHDQGQEEEEGEGEFLDAREEHEDLSREQEENEDDLDRSQPPSPSTGKRRLGVDRKDSEHRYNKRQRIDKGKGKELLEIPSTPEDIINNTQMSRSAHQSSPLKYGQIEPPSPSATSSVHAIRPLKLEKQRPAAHQHVEPETQYFYHSSPNHPQLSEPNMDEDDDEDVPSSICGPPGEYFDERDHDEERLIIQEGPPSPPEHHTSERNVSSSNTRGILNSSSNNASNATTRGTLHSSNNYESSTQSQTESQIEAETLAFIRKHEADGYAQEIIIEALQATTMKFKEALIVIDSLADGDGIPEDIPGVWTSWDDEALEEGKGTDDYERMARKHGISRILSRKRLLRELKASME